MISPADAVVITRIHQYVGGWHPIYNYLPTGRWAVNTVDRDRFSFVPIQYFMTMEASERSRDLAVEKGKAIARERGLIQ